MNHWEDAEASLLQGEVVHGANELVIALDDELTAPRCKRPQPDPTVRPRGTCSEVSERSLDAHLAHGNWSGMLDRTLPLGPRPFG